MKIPLGKKNLEINLTISLTPNLKKLEKELKDFFDNNLINGYYKIKEFEIKNDFSYKIIPKSPRLEECLTGGDYEEKIKTIGEKYGIEHLGFPYWCYGK